MRHGANARGFSLRENSPADDNSVTVGAATRGPGTHHRRIGLIAVRNTSKSRLASFAVATLALCRSRRARTRRSASFRRTIRPAPWSTTNANDSWSGSRGVVFQATTTQTINSISLYQNLTGIPVNYEIDQTTSATGNIGTGKTVLRSGSGTFTTSGLQFITFSFAPLPLDRGQFLPGPVRFHRQLEPEFLLQQ